MRESDVQLGLADPDTGKPLTTTLWGYGIGANTGYLGPTLLAEQGQTTTIKWQNQLPITGYPESIPVDLTLHRAEPVIKTIEKGFMPVVVHLHGGETDARFDGYPEAWYTQTKGSRGLAETGEYYAGDTYTYHNEQQAATLWYHDHALGLTRLNVYAGLAGFYKLTDDNKNSLISNGVLPAIEIPLVVQDKAFTADGKLYFPGYQDDPLPGGTGGSGSVEEEVGDAIFEESEVSALPEFFGDHILVNGTPWPNLDVGQGKYMFNLLNGSDSRFYVFEFVVDGGGALDVIAVGTDGGLLNAAVDLNKPFVLAPGDRLDVVVDFSALEDGTTVRLINKGPAYEPFKGFNADGSLAGEAVAATTDDPIGNIMEFTVDESIASGSASVDAVMALNDIGPLAPTSVRKVGLFEQMDGFGRILPLLGTAEEGEVHLYHEDDHDMHSGVAEIKDFGPLTWAAPTTETPVLGTTETWQIFNFTADAHPIHLHLTQFQGVGRYDIDFRDDDEDGIPDDTTGDEKISYGTLGTDTFASDDILISARRELEPEEGGRQDTLYVAAGEMLEINASFEKAGLYVWHCHILSHEDHEMMRPMEVVLPEDPLIA